MFKYVHHVNYVVRSCDAMVEYLEKNFGMKPDHLSQDHRFKQALYDIGKTQIQITEPLDPASRHGKYLAAKGPGVFHVAWAVDNLQKVAQELATKGGKTIFRGEPVSSGEVYKSSHGYKNFTTDAHGVLIQLIEE